MNKKHILAVADAIEGRIYKDLGFNMGKWNCPITESDHTDMSGDDCGTTACIAGWTIAVKHGDDMIGKDDMVSYRRDAANFLGYDLNDDDDCSKMYELFHGEGGENYRLEDITQPHAVAVLRNLVKTGNVEWDRVGKELGL